MSKGMTRRAFLRLAAALTPGMVLAACDSSTGGAGDAGDQAAARDDPGEAPLAGSDAFEPPVLRSSGGLLEVELSVGMGSVPFAGTSRWALTVNGRSPGPTLRLRPGDRLRVLLDNRLRHSTNLHTH